MVVNYYLKYFDYVYIYINSVLKELHIIHNEVSKYNFSYILNVQTDLKNNIFF